MSYYGDNIIPKVNGSITYKDRSNLLVTSNLGMLYVEMKEIICHGLMWNYKYIDVEITWRC